MSKIMIIAVVAIVLLVMIAATVFIAKKSSSKYEIITDEASIQENYIDLSKEKDSNNKKSKREKKAPNHPDNGLIYYDEYIMNWREKLLWSAVGMAVLFAVGMIFYGNAFWALAISLLGLGYPKIKTKSIIKKRKEELLLQFKEALYSISSSLSAGKSVPSAIQEAYEEMKLIFSDNKDSYIVKELLVINRRLEMNQTIDSALHDLYERSGLEDIKTFAEVFIVCNKTGGNLKTVIQNSSQVIGEKIEIKQEIEVLISGKKFESRILTVIPFVLIGLMGVIAPDLLKNLYSTLGRLLSTIALAIIGVATLWSSKITNIEV